MLLVFNLGIASLLFRCIWGVLCFGDCVLDGLGLGSDYCNTSVVGVCYLGGKLLCYVHVGVILRNSRTENVFWL